MKFCRFFQASLRDAPFFACVPGAEAPGYFQLQKGSHRLPILRHDLDIADNLVIERIEISSWYPVFAM
jgi:hypothetical protein